jgi:uncharacterized membrane protein
MDFLLATAFNEPGKITFYNVVLFVHVASAIVGFSAAFVYPAFFAFARRANERHLPYFHRVQLWFGPRIITGGATLVLLAGLYLAAEGPYGFSDFFISAGLLIVIAILGLGGAFFAPRERKLLELAERDIEAAGGGDVALSADYQRLFDQVERMTWIVAGLVLIAVFLMVTKLGA